MLNQHHTDLLNRLRALSTDTEVHQTIDQVHAAMIALTIGYQDSFRLAQDRLAEIERLQERLDEGVVTSLPPIEQTVVDLLAEHIGNVPPELRDQVEYDLIGGAS